MIAHLINSVKQDFCNNNSRFWSTQPYCLVYLIKKSKCIIQKYICISLSKNAMSSFRMTNICIAYDRKICIFKYYKKHLHINNGAIDFIN